VSGVEQSSVGELVASFRALGIGEGSRVLVHSSLRSLGPVEQGADGVVGALLEAVGRDGLLVVPTFTYVSERFDPATTPGRTGAISEALRQRDGAVRSLHPFYSVAAIGSDARVLCEGHEELAGTAESSPLDRLAEMGGLVLLLGTGHVVNTTVHVGEFRAAVPYLGIPFDPAWPRSAEIVVDSSGATQRVTYDQFPGCSRAFGAIEQPLRRRGAVRDGLVGRALAQLMLGRDVTDVTVRLLAADRAQLLCADPRCYRCSRALKELTRGGRDRVTGADLGE